MYACDDEIPDIIEGFWGLAQEQHPWRNVKEWVIQIFDKKMEWWSFENLSKFFISLRLHWLSSAVSVELAAFLSPKPLVKLRIEVEGQNISGIWCDGHKMLADKNSILDNCTELSDNLSINIYEHTV